MQNRKNGFYWVKYDPCDDWEIMRWDGRVWEDTEGFTHSDHDAHEIDERRITRHEVKQSNGDADE